MTMQPQNNFILHIAERSLWEQDSETGAYRGDTLASEGFIHCSRVDQVLAVANARFHGRRDLALLLIQASKVLSPIKYEGVTAELFPHIYGPLNRDAVVAIYSFLPDEQGAFHLPAEVMQHIEA